MRGFLIRVTVCGIIKRLHVEIRVTYYGFENVLKILRVTERGEYLSTGLCASFLYLR